MVNSYAAPRSWGWRFLTECVILIKFLKTVSKQSREENRVEEGKIRSQNGKALSQLIEIGDFCTSVSRRQTKHPGPLILWEPVPLTLPS